MKRSEVFRSLICVVFGYEETRPVCDLGEALEHYTQIVREELQEEMRGGWNRECFACGGEHSPAEAADKGAGCKGKAENLCTDAGIPGCDRFRNLRKIGAGDKWRADSQGDYENDNRHGGAFDQVGGPECCHRPCAKGDVRNERRQECDIFAAD